MAYNRKIQRIKKAISLAVIILISPDLFAQVYNREKDCNEDTITVNYRLKDDGQVTYKAFLCKQVAKAGFRIEIGPTYYTYNSKTRAWIGNPTASLLGLSFVYDKINIGLKFRVTTVTTRMEMLHQNDTVKKGNKMNPSKIDLYAGYSLDLPYNFSFEPYVGVTKNIFHVFDEVDPKNSYDLKKVHGLNVGITANKYFKLKGFNFLALFATYGYGFSNFRKISPTLDAGFYELSFGLAYKFFGKKTFHHKIN